MFAHDQATNTLRNDFLADNRMFGDDWIFLAQHAPDKVESHLDADHRRIDG